MKKYRQWLAEQDHMTESPDGDYYLVTEVDEQIATLKENLKVTFAASRSNLYTAEDQTKQIAALTKVVKEMDETDKAVREILRPLMDVDGDSHGVPGLEDLAESVDEQIAALKERLSSTVSCVDYKQQTCTRLTALTAENKRLRELCAELVGDDMKKEIE